MKKFMGQWRELLQEAIDEGQERHLAAELFARHMLGKLRRACQRDKSERRIKADLMRKQI